MKKAILLIALGLLWCNISFAGDVKIYYKDENRIELTWTPFYTRQAKIAAQHCAQNQKFASNFFFESQRKHPIYPFLAFLAPSEQDKVGELAGNYFCSVSRGDSHLWRGTHVWGLRNVGNTCFLNVDFDLKT